MVYTLGINFLNGHEMVFAPRIIFSKMVREMDFACTINFTDGTLHMVVSHFVSKMEPTRAERDTVGRRFSHDLVLQKPQKGSRWAAIGFWDEQIMHFIDFCISGNTNRDGRRASS